MAEILICTKRLTFTAIVAILYITAKRYKMTFEEAKQTSQFWDAYYQNCDERLAWKDEELTAEQFFEVWIRKDESCDT